MGKADRITRAPRTSNVPLDEEEQAVMEREMAVSGRTDVVPREGLVGAYTARRAFEGEAEDTEFFEPTGPGADVAPTKRAEERERERHRLEREIGRTPAGEDGLVHDRRAPGVSREALDAVAREADRNVVGRELPQSRR